MKSILTEQMSQSETFYHELFNRMSEGFAFHQVIYDEDHCAIDYRILDINPAFEKQVGIPLPIAKGSLATQLYGVTPAPFLEDYSKVAETAEPIQFQTYFAPLDRHFNISVFSPEKGFFATLFSDITSSKKTEESLIASEERFRTTLMSIGDGVITTDIHCRINMINSVAEQLTGWTHAEAKGKPIEEIFRVINESTRSQAEIPARRVLRDGKVVGLANHTLLIDKNGFERPIADSGAPIFNENGDIVGVVMVFRDQTVERNAETKLRESEFFFRESQSRAFIGSYKYDLISGFWYSSEVLDQIFGIDQGYVRSLLGWEEIIHPDDRQMMDIYFKEEVVGKRIPFNKEYRIVRIADGKLRWVHGLGQLSMDENGQVLAMYGTILDITDRKIFESELIAAKEKAEESDRLKTAFLMNMSHEIRTPMNGILGFLSLLNEPDLKEETKKEYTGIVNKSGQRLLETINDIIEISRIEAGELKTVSTKVDLEEVIQFHFDFFKHLAAEKGIQFSMDRKISGDKALVKTDRHKLDGILTNLIKNAIKFTNEGGIEIGNYLEKDSILFYVKDSGRGIPSNRLEAIFDRFVQADLSNTRGHEGSGLGLSIVKAYVNSLGGKISVQSEVNHGSIFTFSIPYVPAFPVIVSSGKHTGAIHDFTAQNLTILVAEDEITSYKYLEIILRRENINLIHAVNGEETMKVLQKNPSISLILMDIKMPGIDGLVTTRLIRQFNKTIPIIAQTAYSFSSDEMAARSAGCDDYISKPIDRKELLELIRKHTSEN